MRLIALAVLALLIQAPAAAQEFDYPRWRGPPPRAVNPPGSYPRGNRGYYGDYCIDCGFYDFPEHTDPRIRRDYPRYPPQMVPMIPRGYYRPPGDWW